MAGRRERPPHMPEHNGSNSVLVVGGAKDMRVIGVQGESEYWSGTAMVVSSNHGRTSRTCLFGILGVSEKANPQESARRRERRRHHLKLRSSLCGRPCWRLWAGRTKTHRRAGGRRPFSKQTAILFPRPIAASCWSVAGSRGADGQRVAAKPSHSDYRKRQMSRC